ncbi:hypothetical protein IWQ60_001509 [Tieghemiomyces parasiticus]|uniref:Uncharacterized protein n=1 Tax=Tieghemiomyces parasiticus TaxID=78921 RepID=A0A9W8E1U9_9FUNG|nr:hypothetical protein IWQ60_001509 [Tieghemiomyces parasiticus]
MAGQGEASATTAAAKLDFTAAQENLLEGLVHEYAHPIPIHPFDSFRVVRRLEDGGFTRPQAVLLMDVIRSMTIRATAPVHEDMLKKADLDNSMYLFKAALTELRTEIRVLRQIDRAALQSEIDTVEQDIDNLRHRLSEDMINLRSEIQIELNQYKSDQRERVQTMAEAIQELNDTFTRSLGAVRTEMEAVKWETTRKGIIAIYGAVGLLLLLAMMMPSRKPKVEPKVSTEDPYSFESSPAAASEQINGFLNMSSGSGGSGRRPAAR